MAEERETFARGAEAKGGVLPAGIQRTFGALSSP